MTPKTHGQPKEKVIQPISGAKITVAKYCAELKIAEAVARSLLGNHAATTRPLPGKDGNFATPSMKRNPNSTKDGQSAGDEADKALGQGEQGPERETARIDHFRTIPVQQPAAGQLGDDISPAEGRENDTHLRRVEAKILADDRAGDRDRRSIGVVDGGYHEQHGDDQPPDIGFPVGYGPMGLAAVAAPSGIVVLRAAVDPRHLFNSRSHLGGRS